MRELDAFGPTGEEARGVAWSKSRTDRFKSKKSDAYPPPADRSESQQSVNSAPTRQGMRRPAVPHSGESYAECVARKKLEEAAAVPGPGTYAPPKTEFDRLSMVREGPACFNNTAQRWSTHGKNQTGDLGPGEYTESSSIKIKKRHPASLHATPFGVTAGRFGKAGAMPPSEAPGPGAYQKEDTGFLSAQQDKQFGRFEGGFGSVSERFQDGKQQYSADLGPGAYEAVPDPAVQAALQKRRHRGGLSSLDSGISREKGIRESLGIGHPLAASLLSNYIVTESKGAPPSLHYTLIAY